MTKISCDDTLTIKKFKKKTQNTLVWIRQFLYLWYLYEYSSTMKSGQNSCLCGISG